MKRKQLQILIIAVVLLLCASVSAKAQSADTTQTITQAGNYSITVRGADGGNIGGIAGGSGATVAATFALQAGDVLRLVTGIAGGSGSSGGGSGGGGGSAVILTRGTTQTLLIVAAGAGGASTNGSGGGGYSGGNGGQISGGAGGTSFVDTSGSNITRTDGTKFGSTNQNGSIVINQICSNSYIVSNTADSGTGSLRDAITNTCAGGTITFSNSTAGGATNFYDGSQHTIKLTSGDLLLTSDLNIQGPGATVLTIDGNSQNANGVVGNPNGSRIFSINGGTVTISNLTITNGNGQGNNFGNTFINGAGGGIFINAGNVTLQNVVLSNNIANGNNFGGGAIDKEGSGTLTIRDSTIIGNTSASSGGGILVDSGGTLVLSGTTVANNTTTTTGSGYGGGLENYGIIKLSNCTISGNHADNQSGVGGGGIYTGVTGASSIANCTIAGNTASGAGSAGGLRADYNDPGGSLTVINTIVATNTGTGGATADVNNAPFPLYHATGGTFTSGGHNLIGDGTGATGFTNGTNGDQVGTSGAPINPKLGVLANNGGATQTQALQTGSPAIDAGDDCVTTNTCTGVTLAAALATDQRGSGYARKSGTHVDIGAFEAQLSATAASVAISGQVTTPTGRGIRGIILLLTDSEGNVRTATTNSFGYYQFADVQTGETYILSANAKHYTLSQSVQVLNINEETNHIDFIANSEKRERAF